VATADPPVLTVYQLTVPALGTAEIVAEPGPQIEAGVDELIVGIAFTVAITAVLGEELQPFKVAST
jgi:hypothetical protein